jgi:hypothetical protein
MHLRQQAGDGFEGFMDETDPAGYEPPAASASASQ